ALVYQKTLTSAAIAKTSTGYITNLVSNDVNYFVRLVYRMQYLWLAPVELLVVTGILYRRVGWPVFAGISVYLLFLPIQVWAAQSVAVIRKKCSTLRDARLLQLNNVLKGIELIKLYAWEDPLAQKVNRQRNKELKQLYKNGIITGICSSLTTVVAPVASLCIIVVCYATNRPLPADTVFLVIGFLNLLQVTVGGYVVTAVMQWMGCHIAIGRISSFLQLPEQSTMSHTTARDDNADAEVARVGEGAVVRIDQANFNWNKSEFSTIGSADSDNAPVLSSISLSLDESELLAVIGSVGRQVGKTSLCMALLGELPPESGSVYVRARSSRASESQHIAYVPQSPWMLSGTVRDNILFGSAYSSERMRIVLDACALSEDVRALPHGEMTFVGERGITLSGGQKARISIARAVYSQADFYIFDDPLSAVDPHVAQHLFQSVICGLLKGQPRILVTHQLQFLPKCDKIMLLEQGSIKLYGNPRDVLEALHESTVRSNSDAVSTALIDSLQSHLSNARPSLDGALGVRTEVAECDTTIDVVDNRMQSERMAVGSISPSVYMRFIAAGVSAPLVVLMLSLVASAHANMLGAHWVLAKWTRGGSSITSAGSTIGLYSGLIATLLVIMLAGDIIFMLLGVTTARNLFRKMLDAVLAAPAHFFHVNPHGRIINRFSSDQAHVDESLQIILLITIRRFLFTLGAIITVGIVNPYTLMALPLVAGLLWMLRRYFMFANRQVKRIGSVARSPMYSHLSETLSGLSTVRAYKAQARFRRQFSTAQNAYIRAHFTQISCNSWLEAHVKGCVWIFTLTVFFFSVAVSNIEASFVALALIELVNLVGSVQAFIERMAEAEVQFVSVERILEYTALDPEPPRHTDTQPPPDWPSKGAIEFCDMSLTYPGTKDPVLQHISLNISPGEKIGVVGRTGAGKSSLLATLFRLCDAEPANSILIDGIAVSALGVHDLRSRLSIIPQTPVLFHGSLRFNIDPLGEHSDLDIWRALRAAELGPKVEALPGKLDAEVEEDGRNFSAGEQQLISLCRAILRNSRIVVMDEATANVDTATDYRIQNAIRRHFREATVLTIAHRLDTVSLGADRIVVVDAGLIREFGRPEDLLAQTSSATAPDGYGWLHGMVRQAGEAGELAIKRAKEKRALLEGTVA
ncbi:P-loop containing nucleoside triphosphate hydrolase protein, partial [Thamnocephalis sphaerospora]